MKNPHKTALSGLCVALFALFFVGYASAEIINGKEFQRIDGVWYQIDRDTEREYLVDTSVITAKFKRGVSQQQIDDFNARYNVVLLRTNYGGYSDLLLPQSADPIEYCFIYEASGLVEVVEPNTFGEYIQCIPNDPHFNLQWGLHNTGQSGGTVDADLDAPEAWCLETGKPSVIIGILDSGTDWDHEDLGGGPSFLYENIWKNLGEDPWRRWNVPSSGNGVDDDGNGFVDDWKGWDFVNNNNDSRGPFWHGTHVAGIASAKTNNDRGVAGTAGGWGNQGALLMIAGVGDDYPVGSILDDAIYYATRNGAKIITMSLTVGPSQAIDDAINFARNTRGVLVDCAAGNWGGPVEYPANAPFVVAVGASDGTDRKPSWGSYGTRLNIATPGVDIYSTWAAPDIYGYASGTSMAAPHLAGVAALVWSANPNLTVSQVEDIIQQTADKVGGYNYNWDPSRPGHSQEFGFGRANAYQAVLLAFSYANKSQLSSATWSNSARHLLKGGGKLHEQFASGGEIFYRRSSNNGISWELTKRISSGNGSNSGGCLAVAQASSVHLMWQRQIASDRYEVWYSRSADNGSSWTNPAVLPDASEVKVSAYQTGGPMPVIAEGRFDRGNKLFLVFCSGEGLRYRVSENDGATWYVPDDESISGQYNDRVRSRSSQLDGNSLRNACSAFDRSHARSLRDATTVPNANHCRTSGRSSDNP